MLDVLKIALWIAGTLHFCLLLAGFLAPHVLNWKEELQKIDSLSRQLILVHGGFIVLTIIAFGVITLVATNDILNGSALGMAFATFVGVFWLSRLLLQLFYFDADPWLTTTFLKIGYRALTFVFAYFSAVYLTTAWLNLRTIWHS